MAQSLIQLPKDADFKIGKYRIGIKDHEIVNVTGLFGAVIGIIKDMPSHREILRQFEKYGISFEAAIERQIHEMEHNADILSDAIWRHSLFEEMEYKFGERRWDVCLKFSKSRAGRNIAELFIEKIRSCENWEELYDELKLTSVFQMEIRRMVIKGMKQ